jgi:hemin uptake protein HemP
MTGLSPHRCEPSTPKMKPRLQAAALLAGAREVIIEHGSQEYRLQITKQGKLLLTK